MQRSLSPQAGLSVRDRLGTRRGAPPAPPPPPPLLPPPPLPPGFGLAPGKAGMLSPVSLPGSLRGGGGGGAAANIETERWGAAHL